MATLHPNDEVTPIDARRLSLHRTESADSLLRGELKLVQMMAESTQALTAGSVLTGANRSDDVVYRLRSGWVARSCRVLGRNQMILIYLPGDMFAPGNLFVAQSPDRLHALCNVNVGCMPHSRLLAAFRNDPDIADRCMSQAVEEQRRLRNRVVRLGVASAQQQIAAVLIDLRVRLGLAKIVADGAMTFDFPLTQVQLAEYLGITPVHVSRVARSLRDRGIVTFDKGRVVIQDFTALRSIAEPLMDNFERTALEYA